MKPSCPRVPVRRPPRRQPPLKKIHLILFVGSIVVPKIKSIYYHDYRCQVSGKEESYFQLGYSSQVLLPQTIVRTHCFRQFGEASFQSNHSLLVTSSQLSRDLFCFCSISLFLCTQKRVINNQKHIRYYTRISCKPAGLLVCAEPSFQPSHSVAVLREEKVALISLQIVPTSSGQHSACCSSLSAFFRVFFFFQLSFTSSFSFSLLQTFN